MPVEAAKKAVKAKTPKAEKLVKAAAKKKAETGEKKAKAQNASNSE
jgi:hypothetical protein